MRRRWWVGGAIVAMAALLTPGTAGAVTRNVDGQLSGSGGWRTAECAGATVSQFGTGTFVAPGLGVGTYGYSVCITLISAGPDSSITGTVRFITRSGAKLRGRIASTASSAEPTFDVTITGGTKRFARARGALTFGPLPQRNQTNCAHMICADWDESGPITGTVRGIRHP